MTPQDSAQTYASLYPTGVLDWMEDCERRERQFALQKARAAQREFERHGLRDDILGSPGMRRHGKGSGAWSVCTPEVIESIRNARWKIADVMATAQTPFSHPHEVDEYRLLITQDILGRKALINTTPRARALALRWADETGAVRQAAFDLDALRKEITAEGQEPQRGGLLSWRSDAKLHELAQATLSGTLFAWNAGNVAYWLRQMQCEGALRHPGENSLTNPQRLLDAMLLTRALWPQVPRIQDALLAQARQMELQDDDPDAQDAPNGLRLSLLRAALARWGKADGSDNGHWQLQDVSMALLGRTGGKDMEDTKAWLRPNLIQEHLQWIRARTLMAERILRVVMYLDAAELPMARPSWSSPYVDLPHRPQVQGGDLLQRYLQMLAGNHALLPWEQGRPGVARMAPVLQALEPQPMDVLHVRETGLPWDKTRASGFIRDMDVRIGELARQVAGLAKVFDKYPLQEPGMLARLSDPQQDLSADIRKIIRQAFTSMGVKLEGAGADELHTGEKDLRAAKAASNPDAQPLFQAWIGLCKARQMRRVALYVQPFAQGAGVRSGDVAKDAAKDMTGDAATGGEEQAAERIAGQAAVSIVRYAEGAAAKAGVNRGGVDHAEAAIERESTSSSPAGFAAADHYTAAADDRIHPDLRHGPITGRLSCSEPNIQSLPSDARFRQIIHAPAGHVLCACDYSALDMRVGAALAIRTQRRIMDIHTGRRVLAHSVPQRQRILEIIDSVMSARTPQALEPLLNLWRTHSQSSRRDALRLEQNLQRARQMRTAPSQMHAAQQMAQQAQAIAQVDQFACTLAQVRLRALTRGDQEWSSLRDAFRIPGMDIHTWTALHMRGDDPQKMFAGMTALQMAQALARHRSELGESARKSGKVANLSLTYAMSARGLQKEAAGRHDLHWTGEQAARVRNDWFEAFPEIRLWHQWMQISTEMRGARKLPDNARDSAPVETPVYNADTLGGRRIMAARLTSALSCENQASGADIMARTLQTLRQKHPAVFRCIVNQVHDELLAQFPASRAAEYENVLRQTMIECANDYTMPFGVPCEATAATGLHWLKEPAPDNKPASIQHDDAKLADKPCPSPFQGTVAQGMDAVPHPVQQAWAQQEDAAWQRQAAKDDGTPWWQQDCLREDALNEWADAQLAAGQAPSRGAKGAVSLESHLPASPGHDMEGSMGAENESEMPADAMTPQQWRGRPALSGSAGTVRLPGF